MPEKNIPVLEAVMAHIKDRPEHHWQSTWVYTFDEKEVKHLAETPENLDEGVAPACGTAACFAGWTGLLFAEQYGWIPLKNPEKPHEEPEFYYRKGEQPPTHYLDGTHISVVAEHILGLDPPEARIMFTASNSRAMLELMVKDLANGEELKGTITYREAIK